LHLEEPPTQAEQPGKELSPRTRHGISPDPHAVRAILVITTTVLMAALITESIAIDP